MLLSCSVRHRNSGVLILKLGVDWCYICCKRLSRMWYQHGRSILSRQQPHMPASVTAASSVEGQIGRGGRWVVAGIGCQRVESCELHTRESIGYWVLAARYVADHDMKIMAGHNKESVRTRHMRSALWEKPDSHTWTMGLLSQWKSKRLPCQWCPQTSQAMTMA